MNPPSALHGAMSRERKPFTYTPGGLDLSEIKSERMAKRLMRNAMNQGVPEVPIQQVQSPPATSNPIMVPNFNCLPVQVFPTINLPANPKSLLRTRSNPDPRDAPVQRVPPPQHNQFSKPSRPDKPEPLYTTTNNNNFSLPKPVPASTYTPISNNLNNQKQEQPAQIYSPINNNSSYQRPVSMFEYNTEQNNVNTLPQMNYGRSEPSPLLPEISYEAEYFQAPPRNVANKTVVPEYQYNKSIASENSTSADVDTKMKNRTENDNLFQPPTSNGFGAVIAQLECKNENKPYMLHGVPDPGNKQKDNVMQSFTIPNLDISVKSEIIEEDTTRQPHSSSAFKIPDIDISLKTEIVVPRKVEVPESFDIPSAAIVIKPKQDMTYDSIKISDNLQPEEAITNDNPVDLDFSIQPISIARIPSPFEKAVKEESRSDDEQKVVKVVKKQVKKESNSEIQNGNQNGDQEAQMTVKLPSKKSAAKTETNVEVVKKHLPDGSIEEVKTTTTKTTIDGKTTISTKTETTIIPKEEEEEVEVEEEEEEEEDENGVVEVVEENGDDEAVEEVVVIKKSPIVENGHKIVTKEENSETIVTKKVAVVQKQESEAEEEEEEEEEVEEEEVKPEEKPAKASPKEEVKEEQEEEEEVEEEEVVEEKVEVKKQEEDVEEEEVVEEEEKAVVEEAKEEKPEQPKESAEEEEIEEEYEEVEEEKIEESQPSKEIESVETEKEIESEKEEEPKEDEAPKPAPQEDKEESNEKEVIKEEISKEPEEEKQDTKPEPQPAPKPEPSVPLREPSIPLEKVEDVEIKPIGLSSSETVSKSHTENTEIITSNERPSGPLSTQTEYKRIENIVSVNRTTKTLDHSYEQLTQQGVPTVKTYFVPPTLDRISTSPQPARPYQPVYSPSVDKPQERRHSLLLERLSMERQMPSSDIYQNNYQHNNASFEQQRQYSQEPQAEVLTVSNVKPSMITNSQWYQQQQQQQVKKENVIYNNVSSPAPPPAVNQSWSQPQPTQPPSQPQYQPPPQPQYQPPVQPQYQPAYSENINQDRSSSVYQQSAYQPYTPKPATWNPSSDSLSNAQNSQQNQYSLLNQSSTESYQKSTQQYSSGYVPPPWEQDSSYVADVSNQAQNFYQPPPASSTFSPGSNQGWKPTLPKSKFSKPPPTAYIPPAPNQSFVRAANAAEPPRPSPGKKTYYSEYERRYITVPESNYIPGENKYQPQPDPSPQYYYDNNEPSETVEPQWRKELREFTEKSSTQVNEQTSVRPPWEEDPKYVKPPSTVMYTATPTWSQTLRPRSWRERSFESEYVGSQEVSKTSTLGRGRPLSTYAKNSVDAIPERPRGVSVDRYNPNSYQAPIAAEHPPVQTHTLNVVPPAKSYHNPNVPAYHAQSRASAEPREQQIYPQARNWGESRASPIQSRSFKYLQWITGTDE